MIEFLLTSWWIYVPIVLILGFLTIRNNKKIKHIKRMHEINSLPPEERQRKLLEFRNTQNKFDKLLAKYGLKDAFDHIFPKR